MTGPNFRDYHLLLDDQGEQIFAMSDVVAERIRKLGDVALQSIGDIARHQIVLLHLGSQVASAQEILQVVQRDFRLG
jgi:starvation-inducible DNA-binding protein